LAGVYRSVLWSLCTVDWDWVVENTGDAPRSRCRPRGAGSVCADDWGSLVVWVFLREQLFEGRAQEQTTVGASATNRGGAYT
jgi:hypothetical protein